MRTLKCLSALLLAAWAHPEALAQATFELRNYNSQAGVDAPVYDWTGALLAGPGWRAELYGGVDTSSLTPLWDIAPQRREIVPLWLPGYFRSDAGYLAVLSAPPYGWAWLQLRVWNVGLGATYEEAVARGLGGYGQSGVFYARGGDPRVPTLPAPLIGLQSFSVLPVVPEPSACLLLGLGVGGLFWGVRQRKGAFPRRE
jgi:hypothetical protein